MGSMYNITKIQYYPKLYQIFDMAKCASNIPQGKHCKHLSMKQNNEVLGTQNLIIGWYSRYFFIRIRIEWIKVLAKQFNIAKMIMSLRKLQGKWTMDNI